MVLAVLAEGLDASAAERIFGYRQATITTWLTRVGLHAQTLHKHSFCNLELPHLQLDELRTRLRSAKQILAPGCLPLFTSDGLNVYFYALTAHFGHWREVRRRGRKVLRWQVAAELIYGQVKKATGSASWCVSRL